MATKKISQAEARRLQKRVALLERERCNLLSRCGWISCGTRIAQWKTEGEVKGAVYTAQHLGFVLVAKIEGDQITLRAVKP